MKFSVLIAGLLLSLGSAFGASAQEAPQPEQSPPATTALEDVVVEGRPLENLVRDFVSEVGAPARRRGLALWRGEVCVGVVNMRVDAAQAMVDAISGVALEVGLEIGEPGCDPNVVIVATADGRALATELVTARRRVFDVGSLQMDRGTAALRDFQDSDRPVRWWQVSMPVNTDTGERAIRLAGDLGPSGQPSAPKINVFAASRLHTQIRDDMYRSFIIIDVNRIGDVTFQQLTGYVTMMALAQIDADGDTQSYSTILNLFDGPGAPEGMTSWDRTYLQALYSTQSERLNPTGQISAFIRTLTRTRRDAALAEPEE